jgi:hypothetical protein
MFARNCSFTLKYPVHQMGRAHEGRSAADCRVRSRSARDQPQNMAGRNPDVRLGAPGRHLSACHCRSPSGPPTNCGACLALCPSLSLVSPFTFVLIRAHLPTFHSMAIFSRANISEFSILIVFALIMVVRKGNSSTFGLIVSAL